MVLHLFLVFLFVFIDFPVFSWFFQKSRRPKFRGDPRGLQADPWAATFLGKTKKKQENQEKQIEKPGRNAKPLRKLAFSYHFAFFPGFSICFYWFSYFLLVFPKKVAARNSRGAPGGMRVRVRASAPLCLSASLHLTRSAAERHRDREAQTHRNNLVPFKSAFKLLS